MEFFPTLNEDPILALMDVANEQFSTHKPDVFHHLHKLDELDGKADGLKRQIQQLQAELAGINTEVQGIEGKLLEIAQQTSTGFSMGPYRVRYTKGKESVKWDADRLADTLPAPLADLVLSATTTFKADAKLLKTLEEAGKLPSEALECKQVKAADARFIIERVKES